IGNAFGPLYGPPEALRTQVESGKRWSLSGTVHIAAEQAVADRLLAGIFLAATSLVDEEVGMSYDVDIGARVGLRWQRGPFEMMNGRGPAQALEMVTMLAARWNMRVPASLAEHGRTNEPFLLEYVKSRPENGVVTITVNRPDSMNALNE